MTDRAAAPVPVALIPEVRPDPKVEVETPPLTGDAAFENSAMPLPTDPKTIFLGGLFLIAALTACYVTQPIIVPLVMAFFLKLLLQPVFRVMSRWHFPRPIAALLAMMLLAAVLVGLGVALSVPAASWGKTISEGFPRLEQRLEPLKGPISGLQAFLTKAQQAAGGAKNATPITIERVGIFDLVFSGTRAALEAMVTTTIVLFFLMLSGDTFLRRAVEILPNFEHKRRAVEISQQVEQDMSVYLFTITGMNAAVGIVVGVATAFCGLGDPLLWGALAFILNFVPILGPLTGVVLFELAGFMRFDDVTQAVLPGAIYLGVHILEGELATPSLLARRFTMNPVAVILSLIFWYWMWGVPGAILSTPMLAITKILCDRIRPFMAFGHILEGEESASTRYVAAYAKNRSRIRS